ncbi:MAG: hypothetical protein HYU69_12100 [Bacteroidetes bacterium]|nr:hypothetical protein [Bacteroidota bacterium]
MIEDICMFISGLISGGLIIYLVCLNRIRSFKKRRDYYYYKLLAKPNVNEEFHDWENYFKLFTGENIPK